MRNHNNFGRINFFLGYKQTKKVSTSVNKEKQCAIVKYRYLSLINDSEA